MPEGLRRAQALTGSVRRHAVRFPDRPDYSGVSGVMPSLASVAADELQIPFPNSANESGAFPEVIRILAAAPAHWIVAGRRPRGYRRGVLASVVLALAPELHRPGSARIGARAQIASCRGHQLWSLGASSVAYIAWLALRVACALRHVLSTIAAVARKSPARIRSVDMQRPVYAHQLK